MGKTVKNTIRLNLLIVLAVFLSFNSFAWFVYSTRVSNSITAKVKAWRINFESGENEVAEYINFKIDAVYPGMSNYSNAISIVNYGESAATIDFEIEGIEILGDVYDMGSYTLEEALDSLANDYPFSIVLSVSNYDIPAENGTSDFYINVTWPYESGDDVADTYWGHKAYDFAQENPEDSGIAIYVKLTAIQVN